MLNMTRHQNALIGMALDQMLPSVTFVKPSFALGGELKK
jgi:hypothetical protein